MNKINIKIEISYNLVDLWLNIHSRVSKSRQMNHLASLIGIKYEDLR